MLHTVLTFKWVERHSHHFNLICLQWQHHSDELMTTVPKTQRIRWWGNIKVGRLSCLAEPQKDREGENQQQREKKMAMLLKISKVTNLHFVSFHALSAIANLTKPERSGRMLPITVGGFTAVIKKEGRILNALDPTMARVHQLPLCLSNEGTEPACSLSSSHFVQAHTEISICILCLQVINAQGSCNI